MKAILQRVKWAKVEVDQKVVGQIDHGLLVLLCSMPETTAENLDYYATKIAKMRIFTDEDGKMNKSVVDVGGAVLVVSQFTLAAQWRKGNRPGFSGAAEPQKAQRDYMDFCALIRSKGLVVETGKFGAHMEVSLLNDGPVTIIMD